MEVVTGEPFDAYMNHTVLAPFGMTSSGFAMTPELSKALAIGQMWTYDGRTFDAPTFALGTAPAGNLYSTVLDMGKFVIALLDEGRGPNGAVVSPETLRSMWVPQFAPPGATHGFGLGFNVSDLDGHRRVGHNGAVYGFASEVAALPDDGLGVTVIATKDCGNTTAERIADAALRSLLALKKGEPLPPLETTTTLESGLARRIDGHYDTGRGAAELVARGDRLYLAPPRGFRFEVRARGKELVADDPLGFGTRVVPGVERGRGTDGLPIGRLADRMPEPPPSRWDGLIGEYGWDHNTLYVLERQGKLCVLIEWFFFDPLTEVSADVFKFPDRGGLYHGESLKFTRNGSGRATQVEAAGVLFNRRRIDGDDGSTFQITPTRPISELRPVAMAASPPAEKGDFRAPDLVDLTTLDPAIKLDIRYASTNNFAGTPFYSSARAFMQRPAAEGLLKAHQALKVRGYGLLIHDAYRPWYVTKVFWDATPEEGHAFVADPSKGSKHNRGCADGPDVV